jgi:hypothetical protein
MLTARTVLPIAAAVSDLFLIADKVVIPFEDAGVGGTSHTPALGGNKWKTLRKVHSCEWD